MKQEKTSNILEYFSKTLKEQRKIIACQTEKEFTATISTLFKAKFTEKDLKKLEEGNPNTPIIHWIYVWTYFQNIDKIKNAYDAKEMLYLAQQQLFPNIEEEILKQHEKK